MLIAYPLISQGQGVEQLAATLMQKGNFLQDADFEVILPSSQEPVTYAITLQSDAPEQPDSLSPARYVIRWASNTPSGRMQGFSAYFDGHHYRYRNSKLQEYHFADNPDVFMPMGAGSQYESGVQCQAQFADLLPQFIAHKLMRMASDSAYQFTYAADTLIGRKPAIVVEGVKQYKGYDVQHFKYVFDKDTKMPVSIDLETSPGTISEQLISVSYELSSKEQPIAYSEEAMIANWPEVFEKYRESTFRTENLIGQPLPEFSCQQVGGGNRYSHNRNEALEQPVIIAVLDPDVATTAATIEAVRQAVAIAPVPFTPIYAFTTNRADAITDLVGEFLPEEVALMSAGSLVRNCGIAMYPTIIFANSQGQVTDVITGYNNSLASDVIQKASLLE